MKYFIKLVQIFAFILFSTSVYSNDFSFIFDWSNLKKCTSGNPNTVTNPVFYINDIPKGTKEIIFKLKDLDAPRFNHGGGKVSISNLKIVVPEDQKFGEYLFKIEPGNFKYKSPCPPDGQHTYSWSAIANKIEANSSQKYPAVLKANKDNAASSQSEDLKKLQELLDSGVLTEEQFNDAKLKLENTSEKVSETADIKASGVYEFFGVTIGGIIDIENQTIEGKPFKFVTTAKGRREYWMADANDRAWKENKAKSKFIWEGKNGKSKEGRFAIVHKNPDKKEKLSKIYFIEFAYFDNIARVLRVDISPYEKTANKVQCKKRATDNYMESYNSGKYEISDEDHRFNLTDSQKSFFYGSDEDIWIYFGCYGNDEWFWMGAEDNKLTEKHEAKISK